MTPPTIDGALELSGEAKMIRTSPSASTPFPLLIPVDIGGDKGLLPHGAAPALNSSVTLSIATAYNKEKGVIVKPTDGHAAYGWIRKDDLAAPMAALNKGYTLQGGIGRVSEAWGSKKNCYDAEVGWWVADASLGKKDGGGGCAI